MEEIKMDTTATTSISGKVREFLRAKPPLSVVDLDELYRAVAGNDRERDAARAALYHQAAGNPVGERNPPAEYSAIRLNLPYSEERSEDVFLSLPGISRIRVLRDVTAVGEIEQIIARLKEKYGTLVIEYWGNAAQYRTVDSARQGMEAAKRRDRTCLLCREVNSLRQRHGLSRIKSGQVRASHIVSRRATFWMLLDEVDQSGLSIFSDEGVTAIQEGLRTDPLHSDARYIVALCSEHDKLLLDNLQQSAAAK